MSKTQSLRVATLRDGGPNRRTIAAVECRGDHGQMPLAPATVVVRSNEPLSATVSDTIVLFSVEQGKYFALDEISTAIWRELEQPMAIADLCRSLGRGFDVEPNRCERDVLDLLSQLESRGLIRVVE
jgi:hypothetical protein